MKVKARKRIPLQVVTTVDFSVGNLLHIETGKINFTLKEKDDKIFITFEKPYVINRPKLKEMVIEPKIKQKKASQTGKHVKNIRNFINWSEVSRLLVNNASTITKGHTPRRHQENIDELLDAVNEWVQKQL